MIDNTEVSTIKKIPLVNIPQKFKELLKKFEYVESVAITVEKETKETKAEETKVEDTSCLSTEQQIAFEKFKQG